jgi:hypothetical protein
MAEAERGGDLAERRTVKMQTPDGPVEFRPRDVGGVLGFDEIRLGDLRLVQQVWIYRHVSNVHRRKTKGRGDRNVA